MSTATASPLPVNELPLIRDPDLAAAVEAGTAKGCLPRNSTGAQAAIRKVHGSGVTGQYGELLDVYLAAIRASIASD
jgi:hypothetical protein